MHYYFPTIDDLFVAVLLRRAGPTSSAWPRRWPPTSRCELGGTWPRTPGAPPCSSSSSPRRTTGRRSKAELGEVARDVRRMQMEQLATLLDEYGIDPDQLTPPLVAAAMQGLAFSVVQDQVAGYDTAPDEARERWNGYSTASRHAGAEPEALTPDRDPVRTAFHLQSGAFLGRCNGLHYGATLRTLTVVQLLGKYDHPYPSGGPRRCRGSPGGCARGDESGSTTTTTGLRRPQPRQARRRV